MCFLFHGCISAISPRSSLNLRLGSLMVKMMNVRNSEGHEKVSQMTGLFCVHVTSLNNTEVHCCSDNSLQLQRAGPPVKEREFIKDFLDHWFSEEHQQICLHRSLDNAVMITHSSIKNVENINLFL